MNEIGTRIENILRHLQVGQTIDYKCTVPVHFVPTPIKGVINYHGELCLLKTSGHVLMFDILPTQTQINIITSVEIILGI